MWRDCMTILRHRKLYKLSNMHYVYVIENDIDKSWYIGYSQRVRSRLREHNNKSGGRYTKKIKGKWKLIYFEGYVNKKDALGREKFLKSGSGRQFIKKQIKHYIANSESNA